ncbi:hypothetical protein Cgig2_014530 [Carnegiea gigantea]|uniref:Uncharacterized protein n=1 Tax=Carnegiea gigantea TaxID=171969 RepID=A0A9Q1GKL0_9CARY|nr:hypothetical protein Cgig2_014530 [Carnegiea gigantea]
MESSNVVQNTPNREHEDIDRNANKKEGEEETTILEAPKAVPKTKKPALKSEGLQPIEQKDAQLSAGVTLPEEKTSISGQDLNEAQTEAVRSMGFASFLKVGLKQILEKFSKWLVESFDPYSASFMLSDGQRFTVTAFDAYVTLGVLIGGREIMEISKSSTDEQYHEAHAAWVKEWKIEHTTPELTHMLKFILAKKRRRREL